MLRRRYEWVRFSAIPRCKPPSNPDEMMLSCKYAEVQNCPPTLIGYSSLNTKEIHRNHPQQHSALAETNVYLQCGMIIWSRTFLQDPTRYRCMQVIDGSDSYSGFPPAVSLTRHPLLDNFSCERSLLLALIVLTPSSPAPSQPTRSYSLPRCWIAAPLPRPLPASLPMSPSLLSQARRERAPPTTTRGQK